MTGRDKDEELDNLAQLLKSLCHLGFTITIAGSLSSPFEAPREPIELRSSTEESAPILNPPRHAEPIKIFRPTQQQERILAVLAGQALTMTRLAQVLRSDPRRLYRSLRELRARGLVVNSRRAGGYYRPDQPPRPTADNSGQKSIDKD